MMKLKKPTKARFLKGGNYLNVGDRSIVI